MDFEHPTFRGDHLIMLLIDIKILQNRAGKNHEF